MNKKIFKQEYNSPTFRLLSLERESLIAVSLMVITQGNDFDDVEEDDYGDF